MSERFRKARVKMLNKEDIYPMPIDAAIVKLIGYMDAEEQGRLVVLPHGVGDSVFRVNEYYPANGLERIVEWQIAYITVYSDDIVFTDDDDNVFMADDIGKTVFLSREEAEATMLGVKK